MNAQITGTGEMTAKQGWPYEVPMTPGPMTFMPAKTSALAGALAKAQGSFGTIRRDKTVKVTMKSGGSYTFSYAPLESILHAVMPALSANGLALTQSVGVAEGKPVVRTELMHADGESIFNHVQIMVRDEGPQAYGSGLTYARRYGVTLLLCICADDDDDGNAAEGNSAETTRNGGAQLDGSRLTPAKRDAYLPEIVKFIDGSDNLGLRQLWDELSEMEQSGIWSLLNSKQKAAARALLQKGAA